MESTSTRKWFAFSLILIFFMCFILFWNSYRLLLKPLIPSQNSAIILTVTPNATASQFAHLLKSKELIYSPHLFLLLMRVEGSSHHLKAGVYEIKPGETSMQLLHRVVSGDVLTKNFTIIEGSTQQKVAQDMITSNYLKYDPKDWSVIQNNYSNAEGLLLADTYQYQGGSSSKILLGQAHAHLMNYLKEVWANKAAELPYTTPYELLIAASIIEKETAIALERKLIAGVIVNRLKKKMPLQMDPTVIYGLGSDYKGILSHHDLEIPSSYNSYRNRGLPPTPIAMVGKDALDAAAHPQLSNYLYFVAKGDGSHQFSQTYQQQRQAIEHFRAKSKI